MAVFPDLVRDLTDAGRHTDIHEINKRYAKLLQYNVPSGKKSRGLAVVGAYKMFEHPDKLTPENIRLANILGWCVEMVSEKHSLKYKFYWFETVLFHHPNFFTIFLVYSNRLSISWLGK